MEQANHSMFSSEVFNFIPVLERKFFTQDDVVFDVVIVKHYYLLLVDAPVLIKLWQSDVLHHDDFLCLKMTCTGSHKFGITKQLCDNAFW